MTNLYLHGAAMSDSLKVGLWNIYVIEPFIGGGLGVGFNNVSNFHSVKPSGEYVAIRQDNFRTSLAWELSAGLQLINNSNFNLAAGYRYYQGGNFSSNDFSMNFFTYRIP